MPFVDSTLSCVIRSIYMAYAIDLGIQNQDRMQPSQLLTCVIPRIQTE